MAHSSWGSGWPNCQGSKINSGFVVSGTRFPGGMRHELCDLTAMLVQECKNRGYRFGTASDPSYGCWGYSCRAISGSNNPSNHSWGLAVDINAPSNPYTSPLVTDMPSWMPDLWNEYGFRWGGDYSGSKDAMHYEFMESVSAAADYTAKARACGLGGGGTKPPDPPIPPGVNMPLIVKRENGAVDWAWDDAMRVMIRIPTEDYYKNLQFAGVIDTAHGAAPSCDTEFVNWFKGQVIGAGGTVFEPQQ